MPDRLPEVMNREEAKKILAVPNTETDTGLRQRVVLETLYRAGLRASELTNLRVEDTKITDLRLDIRGSKRAQSRAVPIDDRLAGWLRAWENIRPECEYFFCTFKGTQLYTQWLRAMVDRCAEKANLDPMRISPHTFRHSYATELLEDGFRIHEVQQLLGHKSIDTTQVYLHVRPEELQRKVRERDKQQKERETKIRQAIIGLDGEQMEALRDVLEEIGAVP